MNLISCLHFQNKQNHVVVLIFKTTRNLKHTVSPIEQIMKNDAEISEHPVENDVETNVDVNNDSYDVNPGCVCVVVRRTCTVHGVKAKMSKTKRSVWTGLDGSRTITSVSWTCPFKNIPQNSNQLD